MHCHGCVPYFGSPIRCVCTEPRVDSQLQMEKLQRALYQLHKAKEAQEDPVFAAMGEIVAKLEKKATKVAATIKEHTVSV